MDVNTDLSKQSFSVKVNNASNNSATLYAWIDENRNNLFDADEQIIKRGSITGSDNIYAPHTDSIKIQLPTTLKAGYYTSRFRITSSDINNSPTGGAADGEVEDYRFHIQGYTIKGTVYDDGNGINDKNVNGTTMGKADNDSLYAYLTDNKSHIIQKVAVNSDGSYSFTDVDKLDTTITSYRVYISSNPNATKKAEFTLPTDWNNVSQSNVGKNADTTKSANNGYSKIEGLPSTVNTVITLKQRLDKTPEANDGTDNTNTSFNNDGKEHSTEITLNPLTGTDKKDGDLGTSANNSTLTITTLPNVGTLYYNGSVILKWATASEINFNYFDVERSAEGTNWNKIGTKTANGSSTMGADYSFKDYSPLSGNDYYRLKMVDLDGSAKYSSIITIATSDAMSTTVKMYPNPVNKGNQLHIQMSSDKTESVNVRLVNMAGQNLVAK